MCDCHNCSNYKENKTSENSSEELPPLLTKTDVEAAIYIISAEILLGKATLQRIEAVYKRAQEEGLFYLVKQEVVNLDKTIRG